MKSRFQILIIIVLSFLNIGVVLSNPEISLTLIPPAVVSSQVDLDVRAGIKNENQQSQHLLVTFYLNHCHSKNILFQQEVDLPGDSSKTIRFRMKTADKIGVQTICLEVTGEGGSQHINKKIEILDCKDRTIRRISGAWTGFYHWSETEGKMWNPALKKLTDKQWAEMMESMHQLGMDMVVIQECFRNEQYVDKHQMVQTGYTGKSYYPSLYGNGKMPVSAHDPVEAILKSADKLNMHVFVGVGMYAWFDFSEASLEWHLNIASELWNKYGKHPSFYGWYISEENSGGLDAYASDSMTGTRRQSEMVSFFRAFKAFSEKLTPGKPVMLATSSYDIPKGAAAFPDLLQNLDILCPFGFSRMPEGDLTGIEAARRLQSYCNKAGSHLWFDLEAFLFHQDGYLVPRPIAEIVHDLNLFDNFEQILCYQYPGVFSDPAASIRVGEVSTVQLYLDYYQYIKKLNRTTK